MRQLTLATGTFETHRKPTRREKFLLLVYLGDYAFQGHFNLEDIQQQD